MGTHSVSKLREQLEALKRENSVLSAENVRLRKKVEILELHPTLAKGSAGEALIAQLAGGSLAKKNADHDLSLQARGMKIEVKYSNPNLAVGQSTTRRWAWAKIFGESGQKNYDRLLLVGDVDPRWNKLYLDLESPYIFFDVPVEEAMPLTTKTGKFRSIFLSTNPKTVRSTAARLFADYQITLDKLRQRYEI
jgi:hypothetical protein